MAEDASFDIDRRRADYRREMKARRRAFNPLARMKAGEAVAERLLREMDFDGLGRVAGYWPVCGELPLDALVRRLPEACRYHLPQLSANGRLRFAPWRPGDALECNRYGIPEPVRAISRSLEPERLDLVLVPLLAFDRRGHRLGMGAGWYDRSFEVRHAAAPPPLLVGVAYRFQEIAKVPEQPQDVALDFVATEDELIRCRGVDRQ